MSIYPANLVFESQFSFPCLETFLIEKDGIQHDLSENLYFLNAVIVFVFSVNFGRSIFSS